MATTTTTPNPHPMPFGSLAPSSKFHKFLVCLCFQTALWTCFWGTTSTYHLTIPHVWSLLVPERWVCPVLWLPSTYTCWASVPFGDFTEGLQRQQSTLKSHTSHFKTRICGSHSACPHRCLAVPPATLPASPPPAQPTLRCGAAELPFLLGGLPLCVSLLSPFTSWQFIKGFLNTLPSCKNSGVCC